MAERIRVGLIVPSSNVTMETELPALLASQAPGRFSFHSSRMRMRRVTPAELAAMDTESERCVRELSDAGCDVLAYACLVAVMAGGPRRHLAAEARLSAIAADEGAPSPVVTSAGALVEALDGLGARRVALIAPYLPQLTEVVIGYLTDFGITVVDAISLGVADNRAVGRLDPLALVEVAERLRIDEAEAIVLSACVQMPSLPAIARVEDRTGLPVISAATATAAAILRRLDITPAIPDAGRLLASGTSGAAITVPARDALL